MNEDGPGIGEVPLPPGGVRDENLSRDDVISIRYPGETTTAALRAFYDAEMPIGKPWRGLRWHGVDDVDDGDKLRVHRRTWRRGNSDDYVLVDIVDAAGGYPPGVMIFDARDDPDLLDLQMRKQARGVVETKNLTKGRPDMANGTPGRPLGEVTHSRRQSEREQLEALRSEIGELRQIILGHLEVCPAANR